MSKLEEEKKEVLKVLEKVLKENAGLKKELVSLSEFKEFLKGIVKILSEDTDPKIKAKVIKLLVRRSGEDSKITLVRRRLSASLLLL